MIKPVTLRLSISLLLFLWLSQLAFGQDQSGYEKTATFSGLLPDKTQVIFYFSIKGDRASSASVKFVPQGDFNKSKDMNLYMLGKGSPFPQWKGIKMSAEAPKNTTAQEGMYLLLDGERLYMSDVAGHIITVLDWHYEGPVDGRGMACTTCLDRKEAFQAFKRFFING